MGNLNLDMCNKILFKTLDTDASGYIDLKEESAFSAAVDDIYKKGGGLADLAAFTDSILNNAKLGEIDKSTAKLVASGAIIFGQIQMGENTLVQSEFIKDKKAEVYSKFFSQFDGISKTSDFIESLNNKYCTD